MTQAEFNKAQIAARNKWQDIALGVDKEISSLYIQAADEVAEKIRKLQANSRGTNLTAESLRELEKTLRATGRRIAEGTENAIIDGINDNTALSNGPHLTFISDALKIAEIPSDFIDFSIVENMYSQLNETMIGLTYSRLWSDGYNFVQRIWGYQDLPGLSDYWQNDIKNIIQMGFAQERDVLQIAKDITVYAAKGKVQLMKRYGELVRGTRAFSRRIPKNIDWRAIRIARSELYISLQESAKFQGKLNPAVTLYKWNLTGGVKHDPDCLDFAADSPYLEGEVPDFPHSNCLCYITHVLRGRDEFVDDLVDFAQGAGAPYLIDWYNNQYKVFIAA